MALTTMAAVNAALPGQRSVMRKSFSVNAATPNSSWMFAGTPSTGVTPSSGLAGDVPTDATAGSYPFVNPASGNTYLGRMTSYVAATQGGPMLWMLYDRLWHNSGIDRTLTTAQTINSVALTRPDANGARVEAWWEVYVAMGTGTPTVALTYTDQDGNTGQSGSSGALLASMGVGRTGQFTLAAGDTGVRSIQTWQANATFGTSGTIGLVLRRMVAAMRADAGEFVVADALSLGLPRVYDDACLELLINPLQASAAVGLVEFNLVQG